MSATSIIQIDVRDEQFKAFAAAFEKYKESLKSIPSGWNAANTATGKVADTTEKAVKETEKYNEAVKQSRTGWSATSSATEKVNKAQKDLNKSASDGYKTLKEVSKTSGKIASNFASAALSLAKWVSFGGLLSGFGLGGLAYSASDLRRQAQGLGVTTGDLRASGTNFSKYIDTEGDLSRIADIQNDLSRRQILMRLGGKDGQSAVEMLPSLIQNAVKQFNQGGKTSQYAEAMGLTQVFSLEELRRLSSLTEKELQQTIADFQNDRKALAVSDADSKALQDFWIQLKRSGEALEVGLVKVIAPLAPQLEMLSRVITGAITDFLGSKEVKKALEDFTNWISSPQAKESIRTFIAGLTVIGEKLVAFVDWFSPSAGNKSVDEKKIINPFGYKVDKNGNIDKNSSANYIGGTSWLGKWLNGANPDYQKMLRSGSTTKDFFSGLESANKLPTGVLAKMRQIESGGNDRAVSPAGAKGPFQFMPATAKEYGLTNPYDLESSAKAAAKKIKHLLDKYNGNIADALAAYNWGEGNLDKFISGKSKSQHLPVETNNYLHQFGITVNNAAGSDLVITSNALK